jgi:hypothetical protein
MRKFLVCLILILFSGTAMANELTVVSAEEYTPYEEFMVDIGLTLEEPFTGYQYDLVYDETMITCTSINPGALMELDAFTSNKGNTVFGALLNEQSFTESGTINTISFKSTGKTGYVSIDLENIILIDSNMNETPINTTGAWILIDTAPIVEDIPDQTITEGGGEFYQDINITDPDGDEIKTFWCEPQPEGSVANATDHSFRWDEPVEGEYYIEFFIGDGWLDVTEGFTLTVLPAYLEYDINMDRQINIVDLTAIANNFGAVTTERVDATGDGIVNIMDLTLVANHFGE